MTRQNECQFCGSADIVKSVRIGLTAEADKVGPKYKAKLLIICTEPLFADLCLACGTVVRFHVKQTGRQWVTK